MTCELRKGATAPVPGVGPETARVMIVGEAPGVVEDREGRPFIGQSGALIDKFMAELGANRDEIYIANAVNCRPVPNGPGRANGTPEEIHIKACASHLRAQVMALPNLRAIVVLGSVASATVLDMPIGEAISRWRGAGPLTTLGKVVFPGYHPAYLLRRRQDEKAWTVTRSALKGALAA